MSRVFCKKYHRPQGSDDRGHLRSVGMHKSRCPGWLLDPSHREQLLAEALADPDGGTDQFGRPKRVWNAVADWVFVGVSTNERDLQYNCYPEVAGTRLAEELARRANRSLAEALGTWGEP